MISRITARIALKTPARFFIAPWPPIEGSKVVNSLEEVSTPITLGYYGNKGWKYANGWWLWEIWCTLKFA